MFEVIENKHHFRGFTLEHFKEDLSLVLQEELARPYSSITILSKKSGLSLPTLRKLRDKKYDTYPKPKTLLALLESINEGHLEHDSYSFYSQYEGSILEFLKTNVPHIARVAHPKSSGVAQLLKDPVALMIFVLGCAHNGVERSTIKKFFGAIGVSSAENFEKLGLMRVREQSYKTTIKVEPYIFSNLRVTVTAFLSLLRSSKPSFLLPECRSQFFTTQKLNASGLALFKREQDQFLKRVERILEKEENWGDQQVVVCHLSETLTDK